MPTSIERRLRKLEGPDRRTIWHFLEGRADETSRECIIRHGLRPGAPGAFYFVSQGLFPEGYLAGRQR
jgi:hypothetical protein